MMTFPQPKTIIEVSFSRIVQTVPRSCIFEEITIPNKERQGHFAKNQAVR
jgi:hypothetical protein